MILVKVYSGLTFSPFPFARLNLQSSNALSIRGIAALCGVADKSIINGGSFNSAKLAEKLNEQGFECGSLIANGFNAQATWLVIEYFAYDSKAFAPGAKAIARTFGTLGVMQTFSMLTEPTNKSLKQYTVMEVAERLESVNTSTLPAAVKQLLIDAIVDEQLTKTQKAIAPSEDRFIGAAQKAEELGYKLDQSSRTRLCKLLALLYR